ncbi:MerR family transcriptional regulator [Streptomyces cellostaticus]|uniref:MerR family transcriptional regulator n=1 Tax=Streptomyces cellostaticus TaxID=67285 RepID=A0A117PVF9_9ACTN|nr:MerR family transcriptional regulator [Streptomyces cellostaticus]KUM93590.1 MerR family transcriptional regulator [Streptomyces cellostaticus]GHI10147.1 MerR family transcriptional regulator [Streptomyces cellostaticus]
MVYGLTIGKAAAFADVTVKTVRHYHRLGLVDEPERDGSGYRRYGSSDMLRLVQVRTLAGAGVPLAEIGGLLDADPERFASALDDVERRLTDRIEELIARRAVLHRLAAGDRLLLPERACLALDRLAELGFSADYVAIQQEALILARALVPEVFDSFLIQIERQLGDPEYVELMKRCQDAESWDPDDPRLDELAYALSAKLLANRELLAMPAEFRARPDAATRYGLINHHREDQAPAAARLNELLEANLRAAGVAIPHQ